MTPAQALDLLSQTANQFRGTKADHELIAQALTTLKAIVDAHQERVAQAKGAS